MKNNFTKYQLLSIVGMTAFAILMLELILARVYIFFIGDVSSFIAIPVTMLGLSVGALILHWYPKLVKESSIAPIAGLLLLFFTLSFFSFFYLFNNYFGLSSWYNQDPVRDAGRTMALTLIFVPAFATGGMLLSIIFRLGANHIGGLYAIDLIGSAIACAITMLVLHYFGLPITISVLIAVLGILQIVIANTQRRLLWGLMIIMISGLFYASYHQLIFTEQFNPRKLAGPNPPKEGFSQVKHRWDEVSRAALLRYENDEGKTSYTIHHDDGVSIVYVKAYDPTNVTESTKQFSPHVFPFLLDVKPTSALVLFAGVGRDMIHLNEYASGNIQLTGVELSRLVPWLVTTPPYNLFNLNEFYALPNIDYRIDEGRAFLERSQQHYDMIFIGTNGATISTRFGKTRKYLDTYEALGEMLDHLSSDGILYFYHTVFHQERLEALKKLFQERGYAPFKDSVIRVALNSKAPHIRDSYLIKPSGFSTKETDRIQEVCDHSGIKIWYRPGYGHPIMREGMASPHNELVKLSTDNRPYPKQIDFSKFSLFPDNEQFADPIYGPENAAEWLKIFTMLLFIGLALVLVMGFYAYSPSRKKLPLNLFSYFMLTGICYMLVQISMISKLELFFGQPIYSMTIVLTSFLVFNGLGAAFVNWWYKHKSSNTLNILPGLIAVLMVPSCFFLTEKLIHLIDLGLFYKAMIGIISLAPVAFVLGMFYPIGVKLTVDRGLDKLVPMTFGLTTLSSVIGAILTLVFVTNLGFWNMILIAISGYLALILIMSRIRTA